MREVRWNALIEVKFRGDSPGWEFAVASSASIQEDLVKLSKMRPYCDRAIVAVIEEVSPLNDDAIVRIAQSAPEVDLRFIRPDTESPEVDRAAR